MVGAAVVLCCLLPHLASSAKCSAENRNGCTSCCSASGFCGVGAAWCDCNGCLDFREPTQPVLVQVQGDASATAATIFTVNLIGAALAEIDDSQYSCTLSTPDGTQSISSISGRPNSDGNAVQCFFAETWTANPSDSLQLKLSRTAPGVLGQQVPTEDKKGYLNFTITSQVVTVSETAGSAAGGTSIQVAAKGLKIGIQGFAGYVCRFVGSSGGKSVSADSVATYPTQRSSLSCSTPQWNFTHQQTRMVVVDMETGRELQSALAFNPFTFSPCWTRINQTEAAIGEGAPLTVQGHGLDPAASYSVTFKLRGSATAFSFAVNASALNSRRLALALHAGFGHWPAGEPAGTADLSISYGAAAQALQYLGSTGSGSNHLVLLESWSASNSSTEPALGPWALQLSGRGFRPTAASSYSCVFLDATGSLVTALVSASVRTDAIVCALGADAKWNGVASDSLRLVLRRDNRDLRLYGRSSSSSVAALVDTVAFEVTEVWAGIQPSFGSAASATLVTIEGAGFAPPSVANYSCTFGSLQVPAVYSSSRYKCTAPALDSHTAASNVSVDFLRVGDSGAGSTSVPFYPYKAAAQASRTFEYVAHLKSLSPAAGSAAGTALTVVAPGLQTRADYRCRLSLNLGDGGPVLGSVSALTKPGYLRAHGRVRSS
eukprot:g2533.t1